MPKMWKSVHLFVAVRIFAAPLLTGKISNTDWFHVKKRVDSFFVVFLCCSFLTVFDCIWLYLTVFDCILLHLTVFDCIWLHLTVFDCILLYLTTFDCVWLYLTTFDCILLYLTTFDCVWLYLNTFDCIWQHLTVFDFWLNLTEFNFCAFFAWNVSGPIWEQSCQIGLTWLYSRKITLFLPWNLLAFHIILWREIQTQVFLLKVLQFFRFFKLSTVQHSCQKPFEPRPHFRFHLGHLWAIE